MIIYTLWASLEGEEPAPWMIAAEDEFSWEGDPDRCERVFADAKRSAKENRWDVREIEIEIAEWSSIAKAFLPDRVAGDIA